MDEMFKISSSFRKSYYEYHSKAEDLSTPRSTVETMLRLVSGHNLELAIYFSLS